jgi:hypothetical protein
VFFRKRMWRLPPDFSCQASRRADPAAVSGLRRTQLRSAACVLVLSDRHGGVLRIALLSRLHVCVAGEPPGQVLAPHALACCSREATTRQPGLNLGAAGVANGHCQDRQPPRIMKHSKARSARQPKLEAPGVVLDRGTRATLPRSFPSIAASSSAMLFCARKPGCFTLKGRGGYRRTFLAKRVGERTPPQSAAFVEPNFGLPLASLSSLTDTVGCCGSRCCLAYTCVLPASRLGRSSPRTPWHAARGRRLRGSRG